MGDLSENFSRKEFACKCGCGFDTADIETLKILEDVRTFFMAPVSISSACRCYEHNKNVGGASNSQHLRGRAVDITIRGVTPMAVAQYAEKLMPHSGGIGSYNTFTHIDTRTDKARWVG